MADSVARSQNNNKERKTSRDCTVIREIYEHESSQEEFEVELDRALDSGVKTIVIEPSKLGDEASRWITCGNCLHKSAVLSGLGSLICARMWPEHNEIYMPMGFLSVICAGVYAISWQFDPCSKYQVETNMNKVPKLPLHSLTTTTPVILVRKDDARRKVLHNTVSLIAGGWCAYKLYKLHFV
ncbi:transmembrane protein 11, mitochondrial-like [Littorina saxatilis]|uniref:Transmembrane protein 11 n=1 Tax=Littorina saxatilis TaxID=31220 RepID=A0AAN9BVM7_9CAEN